MEIIIQIVIALALIIALAVYMRLKMKKSVIGIALMCVIVITASYISSEIMKFVPLSQDQVLVTATGEKMKIH